MLFWLTGFLAGILVLQTQADLVWGDSGPALACMAFSGLTSLYAAHRSNSGKGKPITQMILLGSGVLIGFSYAHLRAEWRLADELPGQWEGQDILVEGQIIHLPQFLSEQHRPAWRFDFAVDTVLTPNAQVPKQIRLSWYGDIPQPNAGADEGGDVEISPPTARLTPGERWRLWVRLKRPHGSANQNGFDYEAWLFAQNIRATGYVRKSPLLANNAPPLAPTRLIAENTSFIGWFDLQRDHIRQTMYGLLDAENYPQRGVLVALAVGDQSAISTDRWQLFNQTGITHLMVVSGSHITFFGVLVAWLIRFAWSRIPVLALRIPSQHAALLGGLFAAAIYTALSGMGIPGQRTLLMLLAASVSRLTQRNPSALQSLAWALIVVLVFDPWAVLAGGFWLSFATVAALLLIGQHHPTLTSPNHLGVRAWVHVKQASKQQWAAMLATLPVLLAIFQQFPLVSPIANAVAIPLVGLWVTPLTLLSVGFHALIAENPLSELLLITAHSALEVLFWGLEEIQTAPVWSAPSAPSWAIGLGIFGVAILLFPSGIPGRLTLGIGFLCPILCWPKLSPEPGALWVDMLDVGQGQAILIRTANHNLLYDSGPQYTFGLKQAHENPNAGERIVWPFLRAQGISSLDMLLVSHRDRDHAGGTESLLQRVNIREIRSSKVTPSDTPCIAGQHWHWDGVDFKILHPSLEDYARLNRKSDSNALSCVLKVSHQDQHILLTGDLPEKEEISLLERWGKQLKADILVAPHHGSKTSSSTAFLDTVQPHTVWISAGYRNRFKHPHPEVLERYRTMTTKHWRTDHHGQLSWRSTHQTGSTVTHSWRQHARHYWHNRPSR